LNTHVLHSSSSSSSSGRSTGSSILHRHMKGRSLPSAVDKCHFEPAWQTHSSVHEESMHNTTYAQACIMEAC
jgi:hypothetical protein